MNDIEKDAVIRVNICCRPSESQLRQYFSHIV